MGLESSWNCRSPLWRPGISFVPKKVKVAIVPSGGSSCLDISNVRDEAGGAYPALVPSLLESLALLRERDAVHGGTTVQGHTGATRMD